MSAKVVEDRGPLGVHGQRLYRVQLNEDLGDSSSFEMPENEVDPATADPAVYHVEYTRLGKSNRWSAMDQEGCLAKGVKAQGAVGYSTAAWEGETPDDLRHASVAVLLEVDPQSDQSGVAGSQDLSDNLTEQAAKIRLMKCFFFAILCADSA